MRYGSEAAVTKWKVAEAKQRFSEVLREAQREPQQIVNRDRPVAAVIDTASFRQFEEWRARRSRSLAAAFEEFRRLCTAESYCLPLSSRRNRANPFADGLGRSAR